MERDERGQPAMPRRLATTGRGLQECRPASRGAFFAPDHAIARSRLSRLDKTSALCNRKAVDDQLSAQTRGMAHAVATLIKGD
jgi:hypothetical protein